MERESLFRHMAAKIVINFDSYNKISVKFSLQNILRHLQRIYIVVDLEGIVAFVCEHLRLSKEQILTDFFHVNAIFQLQHELADVLRFHLCHRGLVGT